MSEVLEPQDLPGVRVVELKAFGDSRGRFIETYRKEWFEGCPPMVQSNRADSVKGVLRGLHFHRKQADYWYVTAGRIFVALADLRIGSPTRGKVATTVIGAGAERGVYIPKGIAHGYLALDACTMTYQVDCGYDSTDEYGVAWDDPALAVPWPCEGAPLLSDRDKSNPTVADVDEAHLIRM
jgi:dTDP-4-dehydrorhamnose 3,5-epimerase